MENKRDYEALIRELLTGAKVGWSYERLKGWLSSNKIEDRLLAQWLRENGAALCAETKIRTQLTSLAILGWGELTQVASEILQQNKPLPKGSQNWFDRGNYLLEVGKEEEAIVHYDRAIELYPNFERAWSNKGAAMSKLGRHEEAISCFERAIELQPEFYLAWSNRGATLLDIGLYEEAIASCDRAIEIKSDCHFAWNNRGIALGGMGKYSEAISCCNRAIEIQSDYHEAWFTRGIISVSLEQYEEAISSYNRAIEIAPNNYQYWYNKGGIIYKVRRFEETISSYDRAIELKPDLEQAWYNRGIALGDLGRYTDAISSYDRSIEIKPDNYQTWDNRGNALGILHGYRVQIDAYHQSFEYIHPDTHPEGWIFIQHLIGRTHYYEGKNRLLKDRCDPQSYYEDALNCYHNALEILVSENFPELHFKILIDISRVYLAKNNTVAARRFQSEAVDILENIFTDQYISNKRKRIVFQYDLFHQLDEDLEICLHPISCFIH
jgi:tetratricopeptide (TPR) repeat protein